MFITIPKIDMDPVIAFTGSDEEIEKLENLENECSAAWRKIIENPNFSALGFQSGTDYLVLSHSTDNNGIFRLTYFWNGKKPNGKVYDMDPTMHENFTELEKVLFQLTTFCYGSQIVAEIA